MTHLLNASHWASSSAYVSTHFFWSRQRSVPSEETHQYCRLFYATSFTVMLTCMLVALTYLDQGDAVLQLLLVFVETLESLAERYQT